MKERRHPRLYRCDPGLVRAVSGLKGLERRILVYGGSRRLQPENGIMVLPVSWFAELTASGCRFP